MISLNILISSLVLCFVVADVELFTGDYRPYKPDITYPSYPYSQVQDEDDLWEETEKEMEGEDLVIAKLVQIIQDIKLKYSSFSSPFSSSPFSSSSSSSTSSLRKPAAFIPDFTYHFPSVDISSVGFGKAGRVPFAVRPDDARFYEKDFSSNKNQNSYNNLYNNYFNNLKKEKHQETKPVYSNIKPHRTPTQDDVDDNYESKASDISDDVYVKPVHPKNPKGNPKFIYPYMQIKMLDPENEELKNKLTNKQQIWDTDKSSDWLNLNDDKTNQKVHSSSKSKSSTTEKVVPPHIKHADIGIDSDDEYDVRRHEMYREVYDDNMYFVALVTGCSAALLLIIAVGGYSWYKLQKNSKLAADVKYPAYCVSGITKNGTPPNSGDRRLAHSAQMYHYQHQKQQILALETNNRDQRRGSVSDVESDDEHEGDHTVYECPTLPLTSKKTPETEVKKPTIENKPTPSLPNDNNTKTEENNIKKDEKE